MGGSVPSFRDRQGGPSDATGGPSSCHYARQPAGIPRFHAQNRVAWSGLTTHRPARVAAGRVTRHPAVAARPCCRASWPAAEPESVSTASWWWSIRQAEEANITHLLLGAVVREQEEHPCRTDASAGRRRWRRRPGAPVPGRPLQTNRQTNTQSSGGHASNVTDTALPSRNCESFDGRTA